MVTCIDIAAELHQDLYNVQMSVPHSSEEWRLLVVRHDVLQIGFGLVL
jgi:hypothetical protein